MDRLGGLARRMPRASVITFVGTLGIAALPPLNGFVSEWLIFQGLFQGFRTGSHLVAILIVVAAATLGLTSGLAIYAFVRGFGIPYLGMPRPASSGSPARPPAGLRAGAAARRCLRGAGGRRPGRARGAVPGRADGHRSRTRPAAAARQAHGHPAHADFSAFSPTYLAIFLAAACAVPALIYLAWTAPRRGLVSVPVWDGGIRVSFRPRMQYSAMTFSAPHPGHLRRAVPALGLRDPPGLGRRPGRGTVRPGALRSGGDAGLRAVPLPAGDPRRRVAGRRRIRPLQSGDVNLYLLYVFAMILLAYLLGAV